LPDAPAAPGPVTAKSLPLAILKDQISVWTSPVRIRPHDLIWLLPLGAATGVTLAADPDVMRNVSRDPAFNKDSVNAPNYLLASAIAVPVALYGVGLLKGSAHGRETGLLSGEALVDSVVLDEVTKIILRRERPLYNNAAGDFFGRTSVRTVRFFLHTACWRGLWQEWLRDSTPRSGYKWSSIPWPRA
jgi:hypothetical protein